VPVNDLSFLRILYTEAAIICAISMRGDLSLPPLMPGVPAMDDLLMVALIAVLFCAAWGLAIFCERLAQRGRS
jgi:hypothetical protein